MLRVNARDGRLLEVNAALAAMLGYASPADVLINSAAGNIGLTPDQVQHLTQLSRQDGQVIGCDIPWMHRDGTSLIIGLRGRLLRDGSGTASCLELVA